MNTQDLRENLEELHLKLLQMAPQEQSLRNKRDTLAAQIRASLDQTDLGGLHIDLKESLAEALAFFEEKHPDLFQLIRKVTDTLSSIGI